MGFLFVLILFVVCVGGGWLLGKFIGVLLFGSSKEKHTYITKNIHYHNHYHEHKSITIIDEETRSKVLEMKESTKSV